MPVDWDLVRQFALALGLGGLIGLERERHHDTKSVLAGARTLPLVSLGGLLVVLTARRLEEPFVVVAGLLVAGALASLLAVGKRDAGAAGLTTPVAFLVTFLIGVLIGLGMELAALIAGVATTALLMAKQHLHRLADVLTEEELRSAILLVVLAFIVYPFVPAHPIGPGDAIALRQAILIVVLVSAMSFVSFLAMRRLGPARGLPWMGFLGGLASSMAAVGAIVAIQRKADALKHAAVVGVLAAAAAMLVRNLVIAAIADPHLAMARLVLPAFLVVAAILVAFILTRRTDSEDVDLPDSLVRNPFAIGPALKFGLLFLVLSVAAALLQDLPGGGLALYLTALGGIVATGPVFAAMAVAAGRGLDPGVAASVALTAAALSLAAKWVVARQGSDALARPLTAPLGLGVVVAAAGALLLRLL